MGILLPVLIFLVVVGGLIFLILYLIHRKQRASEIARVLNTRVFLVTLPKEAPHSSEENREPPKDFRQYISVAEQMFASFSSLYQNDVKNRILKEQQQISLEIVAQEGVISFYIACPKMFEEMVEKQINASYPVAHIEKVRNPNIFTLPSGQGEFAAAKLKLEKKFVLPIKTYTTLESDGLGGITNAMSKLGENTNAAYQIIIRPANDLWRGASTASAAKIQGGKHSVSSEKWYLKALFGFFEIMGEIFSDKGKKQGEMGADNKPFKPLTPMQEGLMKAINDKAAKNGFEVNARIVVVAKDKQTAQIQLQAITSSFSQFGTPEVNDFKISSGNALTVKEYILRHFTTKKPMILNTEELASIFHFPNYFIDTPNIRWLMAKQLAAPANMPQEGTVLGKNDYRDVETLIRIKTDDRRKHLFMIGKTGTGKTTLFSNCIEQDMHMGYGCCFIDPNGDAIEDLLAKIPPNRMNDVILFDPGDAEYPSGLNLMEYQSPEQRDFLIQETIQIFYKLFDPGQTGIVGPQWEHWFRNAALTIMSQPGGGTLIDVPRIFTDDSFRTKLVSHVTDPLVKSFWDQQLAKTADFHKSEMYNYFISKFGRFMTNDLMRNIIGQKKSAFDIRQVMDEGKILLINLSKGKIGEINSNLLGMIIVSKIQMAAFSRADIPEEQRKDFYLYVDEFQNFTTDSFATILSEARKYRLNLNVANQYIAQLTENIRDAVIGNAGTMVSYRIGAADAEFMEKEFPGVSVADFTNLDKFNAYVKLLIDGTPSKPFSMKGIKSPTESNENVREQVRNFSRQNYARPVSEVNAEIEEQLKSGQSAPAGVNEPLNNL